MAYLPIRPFPGSCSLKGAVQQDHGIDGGEGVVAAPVRTESITESTRFNRYFTKVFLHGV